MIKRISKIIFILTLALSLCATTVTAANMRPAKTYTITKAEKKKIIKRTKTIVQSYSGSKVKISTDSDVMIIKKTKHTYSISGYFTSEYNSDVFLIVYDKTSMEVVAGMISGENLLR